MLQRTLSTLGISESESEGYMYYMNDPSTPNLQKKAQLPMQVYLPFSVQGFHPEITGKDLQNSQRRAIGCYITIGNSINYFQEQHSMFNPPIHKWAMGGNLKIVPEAGKKHLNAYYDRGSLKFFYDIDPITKQTIYTSDSADIVSHELGHAILDSIRPDLWSMQSIEVWGFHEAFSDINAILSIMQHEEILNKLVDVDLNKSNIASRLAEQMGLTIYNVTKKQKGRSPLYLRDAANRFDYENPINLPTEGNPDELLAECHSFGLVFLGAWYEIMIRIFKSLEGNGVESLKAARDAAARCLYKSLKVVPKAVKFTEAIAETMMAVDRSEGGNYVEIMKSVFTERNIITPKIKMLSGKKWSDVKKFIRKNDAIISHKNGLIVRCERENNLIKLSDRTIRSLGASNEIFDLGVEIPNESYYEFDQHGNLVNEINNDEDEAIESAMVCAQMIYDEGHLGSGDDTMWEIFENKLIRTFIE